MTIYAYCRTSEHEDSMDQDQLNSILEPELLGIQTYCLQRGWYMTETITEINCRWNQNFVERERGKLQNEEHKRGEADDASRVASNGSAGEEEADIKKTGKCETSKNNQTMHDIPQPRPSK